MTPQRKVWFAAALWVVLAIAIWNVIFDRVVVLAGRRFVYDATLSARAGVYLRIDDAMRPAIVDGVRRASVVALSVVLIGVGAIWLVSRPTRR